MREMQNDQLLAKRNHSGKNKASRVQAEAKIEVKTPFIGFLGFKQT